jgi:hypothetical protein
MLIQISNNEDLNALKHKNLKSTKRQYGNCVSTPLIIYSIYPSIHPSMNIRCGFKYREKEQYVHLHIDKMTVLQFKVNIYIHLPVKVKHQRVTHARTHTPVYYAWNSVYL